MLRERVFKVKAVAPKDNISSNSKFYNLSAKDIDGNVVDFSDYKGKKLLNTRDLRVRIDSIRGYCGVIQKSVLLLSMPSRAAEIRHTEM